MPGRLTENNRLDSRFAFNNTVLQHIFEEIPVNVAPMDTPRPRPGDSRTDRATTPNVGE